MASKGPGRAVWFKWQLAWKDSLLSLNKTQLVDLIILTFEYFANVVLTLAEARSDITTPMITSI